MGGSLVRRALGVSAFLALALIASGCSSHATPNSICSRMISTCMCFSEAFRRTCVSTIESYEPTQEQLDCAGGQPCETLCSTSTLLAVCYTRADAGAPDAGDRPDAGAGIDVGASDAPIASDVPAATDAPSGSDTPVTPDGGASCGSASACAACVAVTGCGWCRNRAACFAGTASGPSGSECAAPQWSDTAAECP